MIRMQHLCHVVIAFTKVSVVSVRYERSGRRSALFVTMPTEIRRPSSMSDEAGSTRAGRHPGARACLGGRLSGQGLARWIGGLVIATAARSEAGLALGSFYLLAQRGQSAVRVAEAAPPEPALLLCVPPEPDALNRKARLSDIGNPRTIARIPSTDWDPPD
jgi:hypothetical protein